jgi:hypothetical protein
MKLSIEAVDAKKTLRIVWILEGILYFIVAFIVLIWKPEHIEGLVKLSPYLTGLIVAQGGAAWSGSSIKRVTESWLENTRSGGGDA